MNEFIFSLCIRTNQCRFAQFLFHLECVDLHGDAQYGVKNMYLVHQRYIPAAGFCPHQHIYLSRFRQEGPPIASTNTASSEALPHLGSWY